MRIILICIKYAEVLYGAYADSAQLENMFKSFHMRLYTESIDTVEYNKLTAQARMAVEMQMTPLMKAIIDIMSYPYVSNERTRMPTKEEVFAMSISKMKDILARLHSNYNGMVAVVKTPLKTDVVLPLAEKYLINLRRSLHGLEPQQRCCPRPSAWIRLKQRQNRLQNRSLFWHFPNPKLPG